jgi:hypothetical protein
MEPVVLQAVTMRRFHRLFWVIELPEWAIWGCAIQMVLLAAVLLLR